MNLYLKITILCLFSNGWIISQCPQTGTNEYSQCSIGIDLENTHLVSAAEKLQLYALIHHPGGGNDDDAHQILVTITSDIEILEGEVSVEKDGEFYIVQYHGKYATAIVNSLPMKEHLDVRYSSNERCHYNISVNAIPMTICDIDYTDNHWSMHSRCWPPAIVEIYGYPGLEIPEILPVDIPTICQQISSICDDCFSRNSLCVGESIRFNLPPEVVSFDLYEIKNGRPLSKPIAIGKNNKKHWSMNIPIEINRKNQDHYSFVVTKKK